VCSYDGLYQIEAGSLFTQGDLYVPWARSKEITTAALQFDALGRRDAFGLPDGIAKAGNQREIGERSIRGWRFEAGRQIDMLAGGKFRSMGCRHFPALAGQHSLP